MAKVSIKYKKKTKGRRLEVIKTKPVEVLIVINEDKRVVKFKTRVISRVCRELNLNVNALREPNINSVEILKDLGKTNYDI